MYVRQFDFGDLVVSARSCVASILDRIVKQLKNVNYEKGYRFVLPLINSIFNRTLVMCVNFCIFFRKSTAANYIILILLKLVFRNMEKAKNDNPALDYNSNNVNNGRNYRAVPVYIPSWL